MVPKDASTREPVNFIKKNKKLLNDKKRKVSSKGEKNPDSRRQSATPTETRSQPNEPKEPQNYEKNQDFQNSNMYISVSPRIFRKNVFHSNKLQREIKVPSVRDAKTLEFDPAAVQKAPLYLEIPNLYNRKAAVDMKKDKIRRRYKFIQKLMENAESASPRYKYVPRPATPRDYNPRPKSSNRYVLMVGTDNKKYKYGRGPVKSVFKPKERYFYKPRPATPKNYKPKPKAGVRYKKRYVYPSKPKTIFKYVGCYKYRPRPASAKNHRPKPKLSNRYVCQVMGIMKKDVKNPYAKRSIFKPKVRYSFRKEGDAEENVDTKETTRQKFRKLIMKHTENERNVENIENTLPENNEIEDDYSDDTFEAESQDGDEVIMDDGLDEAVSAESQEAASSTVKSEATADVDPAKGIPVCHTNTTDADVKVEDVQTKTSQENENKDKVVETNISPEVKENVPMESSVPVKNTISPEESKSPITAKEETVDKINSSSEKNETDKPKETSKSSLGLWFNTELRKQIQLTPKGWELRSV